MPSVKVKFSLSQQVSVIKSGKSGSVMAVVVDQKGTHYDVQMPAARRPWRYSESDLQTVAEAAKAMKAHAKKVGAPVVATPVAAVAKVKVKAKAAKPKATAKVVKAAKPKAKKVTI